MCAQTSPQPERVEAVAARGQQLHAACAEPAVDPRNIIRCCVTVYISQSDRYWRSSFHRIPSDQSG